jgi:hypothetical protein
VGVAVGTGVAEGRTVLLGLAVGLGAEVFPGSGDGVQVEVVAGAAVFCTSAVGSGLAEGSGAGRPQAPRTIALRITATSSGVMRTRFKGFSRLVKWYILQASLWSLGA